jgi:FlaA1/EpsC-like NDP-sugar epimerase
MVFLFDLATIGVAFYLAFLLRFDFKIPPEQMDNFKKGLLWVYVAQSSMFITQGLYRGLWSFASIRDLFIILRGVTLGVITSVAAVFLLAKGLFNWPRSVFLLDGIFLVLILGGGRFAYRFFREVVWTYTKRKKKILVVGAGASANLIAREFSSRPELMAKIVGFLDDNPALKGFKIQGAPVLGKLDQLAHFLEKYRPQEVIIASPSLQGGRVKAIVADTRLRGIACRICPPIRDVLLGRVELNQLREVAVEDLLRRDVVHVDESALEKFVSGRAVLVTGAGGSIGSELCRQILKFNPHSLVMYDRSEFNLYRFEQELRNSAALMGNVKTDISFVIGDILDPRRLNDTFDSHKPEIVLHAAAFKHVPLMEENIYEALRNNVFGTYSLVQTAVRHGVRNFVLISTDKAVRPTNVMGATKRMAELVANAVGSSGKTITSAVRFGNVLGSEGSVLPRFREQIAKGGPVTVTHREITRYFMTIPEASLLVLQASVLGRGGEIFLLDMGEPILIRELAEELIKLSGLKPYTDIDIVFTGLRPGEKLYEELLIDLKNAEQTTHRKIMCSSKEHGEVLPENWESTLMEFVQTPQIPESDSMLQWIKAWVPEFTHKTLDSDPETEPESLQEAPKDPTYLH